MPLCTCTRKNNKMKIIAKKKHWFLYHLERKPAPVRKIIGSIAN